MENINLLFVDDEPAILRSLTMQFRKFGGVFTAENGAAAIQILRENKIHVLVSDQRMPNMTGVEVLTAAKTVSPNTTRVLLTGYADLAAVVGSVNEAEVFQYVNKPWDAAELVKIVKEAAEISLRAYRDGSEAAADAQTAAQIQAQDRPQPGNDPPATAPQKARGNLLIIDDDAKTIRDITELFENALHVFSASSLKDAAQILKTQSISIIIAELRLGSGYISEFVARVKHHYPSIMILIQSSVVDSSHVINLINQGHIVRYLSKPMKKGLLKLGVERAQLLRTQKWGHTKLRLTG